MSKFVMEMTKTGIPNAQSRSRLRNEAIQFVEDYLEELDAACESQAANNGVIRIWSSATNQLIEI